jgi:hypothetical protein
MPLNLSQDANGWTEFSPSNDTRICYIAADGDDGTAQYYNDTLLSSDGTTEKITYGE